MLVVSLGFRKEIRTSLEPLCDVICITFLAAVTKCLTKVIYGRKYLFWLTVSKRYSLLWKVMKRQCDGVMLDGVMKR